MASQAATKAYDRRNVLRTRLTLPATIFADGVEHRALLGNLSEQGAMIETARPLEQGKPVVIKCGSIQAEGVVAWQCANRCGIAFDVPIPEEEISRQILWTNATAHRARATVLVSVPETRADSG